LFEDQVICAVDAARCVDVFHAHQPLAAMCTRVKPTRKGSNERARMQRARGGGSESTDVGHNKITRAARV
jgi:hypothetical protein